MYLIGVDPDVKASGFAVWNTETKKIEVFDKLPITKLTAKLKSFATIDCIVYIEAGWLNKKSNYHYAKGQSKYAGEKIAKNVGANHQVGKIILEFCKEFGLKVELVQPKKSKVGTKLFKNITGITATINQDVRDAVMLVYGR